MCRRARPPCHTSEPAGVDRARVPTSFEERLSSEIASEYVALAAHRCDPDVRVGDHAFKQVAVRVFGIERAEHHVVEPLPRRADVLLRYMVGTRAGPRCGAAARPGARRNPPSARLPRAVWRAAPAHSHTPGSHAARRRPHPSRRRARSRNAATCRRGRTPSSAPMSTCRSPAVRAELTLSDSGRAPAADS